MYRYILALLLIVSLGYSERIKFRGFSPGFNKSRILKLEGPDHIKNSRRVLIYNDTLLGYPVETIYKFDIDEDLASGTMLFKNYSKEKYDKIYKVLIQKYGKPKLQKDGIIVWSNNSEIKDSSEEFVLQFAASKEGIFLVYISEVKAIQDLDLF